MSERSFTAKGSSAIASVTYTPESHYLYVTMKDHSSMVYEDVPLNVYQDFRDADSHGRFFNQEIRDNYPFRRL